MAFWQREVSITMGRSPLTSYDNRSRWRTFWRPTFSLIFVLTTSCTVMGVIFFVSRIGEVQLPVVAGRAVVGDQEQGLIVDLVGEWELIDHRWVPPYLFHPEEATLAHLPGFPSRGRRQTYRVLVTGLDSSSRMAIYLPRLSGNARLFVNGVLVGYAATPRRGGVLPLSFGPTTITPLPVGPRMEIVIQLENYTWRRSGMWQAVRIAPAKHLQRVVGIVQTLEAAITGALFIFSAYHLALFFLQARNTSTLYFALFGLMVALRSSLVGHHSIFTIGSVSNPEIWAKLMYFVIAVAVPLMFAYLRELFPSYISAHAVKVWSVVALLQMVATGILPLGLLQREVIAFQCAILIAFLQAFVVVIRAWKHNHVTSVSAAIGLLFLLFFTFNDVLYDHGVITTGYMLSVGFFGFLFSQAVILAARHNELYEEAHRKQADLQQMVQERTSELERLSNIDQLTNLFNRRYGEQIVLREIAYARRYLLPLTLAMLDIDHFKRINDTHGHQAGDEVLQELSALFRESFRESDYICRWGGEEFLLILPHTTPSQSGALVERVLATLRETPLLTRRGPLLVTFSGGIAGIVRERCVGSDSEVLDALLAVADNALYRAKSEGRDRIEIDATEDLWGLAVQ